MKALSDLLDQAEPPARSERTDFSAGEELAAANPDVKQALETLRLESWREGYNDGWHDCHDLAFSRGYEQRVKDIRKAIGSKQ
jgi:hypothetical protein